MGCQESPALATKRSSTKQTAYQRVEVWRSEDSCEFRVSGASHAFWHRERFLTGRVWDTIAAAALLHPGGAPKSLLMLGLAGGTATRILRYLLPECRFTAVDLDEELVELAREHMELDEQGIEVHIGDAYKWAADCKARYDVVIDDCYMAGEEDVFRPEKKPGRGVEVFAKLLAPGGLMLANVLTGAGHRRMQSRTRAAFRRQFESVGAVTTLESQTETVVGGDEILSGVALSDWAHRFGEKDRVYWGRLGLQRLK